MAESNPTQLEFATFKSRKVVADVGGGEVSSNGGLLLLREIDRRLGLTRRAAPLLPDDRQAGKVEHGGLEIARESLS